MLDIVQEHLAPLLTLAALAAVAWAFNASRVRIPTGAEVRMTVYCGHCNWEGRVPRAGGQCARCHSRNLHVLAV